MDEMKIRRMKLEDETSFVSAIKNEEFCRMYGFHEKMSEQDASNIFRRFVETKIGNTIEKNGFPIGFLLDVNPEIPEEDLKRLPKRGRTLAYAIYPQFQRNGYMKSALTQYINKLFDNNDIEYIHCGVFEFNIISRHLLEGMGFEAFSKHNFRNNLIINTVLTKEKWDRECNIKCVSSINHICG